MNSINEDLVREEQEKRWAREEAARRDTASTMKTMRTLRYVGWACAFVPVIGIVGVGLFMLLAFLCCIYAHSKGNTEAIKQLLFTLAHGVGAGVLWVLVNLTLAFFATALSNM